jgi:hypothetical protein
VADFSGNEDIRLPHGLAALVFWSWLLAGAALLVWLNLAHVAASFPRGSGNDGPLATIAMAVLRPREVAVWFHTVVWQGVFGGQLFMWPFWYIFGRLVGQPTSQTLWTWIYYTSYAFRHAIGAPPILAGIIWNLALLLCLVGVPALFVSGRMGSGRKVDLRLGTAHWPSPKVLKPYLRAAGRPGSLPLGRIVKGRPGKGREIALPLRDRKINIGRASHAAVWGVSEAGKTSGVFKTWLWRDLFMNDQAAVDRDGWPTRAMSSVVVDMKHAENRPDIYGDLAPYAAKLPRRLLMLAPGDVARSLHYNPLDFVRLSGQANGSHDIDALADAIIQNTPRAEKDDQYHQGREWRLLRLLIEYVCDVQEAAERGVREVAGLHDEFAQLVRPVLPAGTSIPSLRSFSMIAAMAMLDGQKLLGVMQATITDPAYPEDWRVRCEHFAKEAARKEDLTGWLEGLQRRLAVFTSSGVATISNRSDFSLDLVGRQPSTLIIAMPRELTRSLEVYSALIITQLLQQLKRVAGSSRTGWLPVPVTLYLDELPAQGRIPQLEHEIATLRDMAVTFVCGMQSSAALEGKYGKVAAEAIKSTTNTKIVIGRNLGHEDAEYFSGRAGETTILVSGATQGPRGESRSTHLARRALTTTDQIQKMRQFEALVFLQTGHVTQTRLLPFHEMTQERARTPCDQRFVDGGYSPHGHWVSPAMFLRARQAHLDRMLGPWDTRPGRRGPAASATGGVAAVTELQRPPAAPPRRPTEPVSDQLAVGDHSRDPETLNSGSYSAGSMGRESILKTPAVSVNGASGPADIHDLVTSSTKPRDVDRESAQEGPDPGAVGDLAGLFNSLVRGRLSNGQLGQDASPGWWLRLPGGDHLLLRWSFARSFGELRRTKASDIAGRWQLAGLVIPRRLSVGDRGENIPVLAFTPEAIGRLTPAVTDVIGAWPRLVPGDVRGLKLEPPAQTSPSARSQSAAKGQKNGPEEALLAVIAWVQANKGALQSASRQEQGQWEATVQGESALLIRQAWLNRILLGQKFDLRAIMGDWRETGIIIAEEKRFTVYTRVADKQQQGARFVAFRWDRLETAGLSKR